MHNMDIFQRVPINANAAIVDREFDSDALIDHQSEVDGCRLRVV